MIQESFMKVYTKFKLHFYQNIFERFEKREASLTTVETFSIEIIYALQRPTINEFAQFAKISKPNATYKVNSLVKKGYVKKVQSQTDKREFYLEVTPKYFEYYNVSYDYIRTVSERLMKKLSDDDAHKFEYFLNLIADELTPEIELPE